MSHETVFHSVAAATVQAFQMVSVERLELSAVSEMISVTSVRSFDD